jgi:hypothetical protein
MGVRFLDEGEQAGKIRFLNESTAPPPAETTPYRAPSAAQVSTAAAIPFISEEARKELADIERGLRGGILEGLGSIGATVIRPFETARENALRRAAIKEFATNVLGAPPDSVARTIGTVGTQVAGTAGVGPALGIGARAVPMLRGMAPAIESGGFVGSSLPARMAGGGIVGGAAAGLTGEDLATGAGVGAVAGPALSGLIKAGAQGAGATADVLGMGLAERRATNILREAIGEQNLPAARAALRAAGTAPPDEALIGTTRPAFMALVDKAARKDPDGAVNALRTLQGEEQRNELARIAGGFTQTQARATREQTQRNLRELTAREREEALTSAGLAGRYAPGLETDVSRFQGAAAGKVEDVRRMARAENKALGRAAGEGMLGQTERSARFEDLAARAQNMMDEAATGSLNFGEAARLRQYQLDSLAAEGLQPLKTDVVIDRIKGLIKPSAAGNRDINVALNRVVDDLREWTNNNGIIHPDALEAIRKNSVANAIQNLYKDPDSPVVRKVAAGILSDIKPIIDDAIEQAGGAGWRNYLKAFESGMAEVNQQRVAAKALDLFKNSPDEYVNLVRGDRPKDIEKVFGVGSYDVVKEMGARYPTLSKVAEQLEKRSAVKTAIEQGREPIEDILQRNKGLFKLPAFFDPTVTAGNRILSILGAKVDTKTMDLLIKAMRSNEDLLSALDRVPAAKRNTVLKALSDDRTWIPAGSAVTSATTVSGQE